MTIRPGDLCLVIGGPRENCGLCVTALEMHTELNFTAVGFVHNSGRPYWLIDKPIVCLSTCGERVMVPYVAQEFLMPIRPGRDEPDGDEIQAPRSVVLHSLRELHEFLGAE